ncbi:MAG: hypothetical protein ACK5OW_01940 [bacterium]|jgi:hypothetical protein
MKKIFRKIKLFFKMRYARTIIGISQSANSSNTTLNEIQKTTLNIFNTLVRDEEADLLYAPLSEKQLIQKGNVFLSINKASNGCIINVSGVDKSAKTNYHYDVWFNEYYYNRIKTRFTKSIDKRRSNVEVELVNRDKESLEKILKDIRNNEV